MQKVVSNSSPLIHLAKIGKIELLKDYFSIVSIPEAVYKECIVDGKNHLEVALLKKAGWLKISQVKDQRLVKLLQSNLDNGESEAITLSLEIDADLIVLDDSDAREKARLYGLKITGSIGILLKAKMDGKIHSLKEHLYKLRETGFRIGKELEIEFLKEAGEL